MEAYLPVIWAILIAAAVALYVILDGFDLGVGVLFPFVRREEERDAMMNSIAPFWDGNETWLVLGGGGLWVAFPRAYAVIMPALYLPVIVMLLALIFRGVSFEFRFASKPKHGMWDFAFAVGSIVAAFSQGVILGGLIQGITVVNGEFAGGPFEWATPFALMCGVGLVVGYALLGATWLVYKTSGDLQHRARRWAWTTGLATVALIVVVSAWTPLLDAAYMARWLGWPRLLFVAPVPLLVAAASWALFRGLRRGDELRPFLASLALFVLGYAGLLVSFYPYLVPTSVTFREAAAPAQSLGFLLAGAAVLLPVILAYTAYSYWVFRGKVDAATGYH